MKILKVFTCFKRGVGLLVKWPEQPLDLPVDQGGGFYNDGF